MKKRLMLSAAVALGAFGCTGIALAVSSNDDAPQAQVSQSSTAAETVEAVVADNLAIFRESTAKNAGAKDLPGSAQVLFATELGAKAGANLELARRAETPAGPVIIVPGNGSVCQIGPAGWFCTDSEGLAATPERYVVFSGSMRLPKGKMVVSGIATDSVRSISAIQDNGEIISVPVSQNAYGSLIPSDTETVRITTTDGVANVTVPHVPVGEEAG